MDLAALQRFCGPADGRPALATPLTDGADTYASDAALVVRWRGVLEGARSDALLATQFARCIADAALGPEWLVPVLPPGIGADRECPRCLGAEATLHCGDCGGTKRLPNRTPVVVGGPRYQAHYLALLLRLPGLEMAPDPSRPRSATPFRFEGGDGAIMPLRT